MSATETAQKTSARGRIFRDLEAVRSYLADELGLKVSMRTVTRRSQEGVLYVDENGLWSTEAVDVLASTLPPALKGRADVPAPSSPAPRAKSKAQARAQAAAAPMPKDAASLPEIKLKAEIKKIMVQTAGIEHENAVKAGKYFRKSDVWLELVHRASVLYAGLAQDMHAAAPEIVRAALEDPARGEELYRQALDGALARAINNFSRPMSLEVETWTDEIADDDIPEPG